MKKLSIIDTLGPFVVSPPTGVVNWSKVDFSRLETNGRIQKTTQKQIADRFSQYIGRVSELGYDAISIDDLAHLVILPFYNKELRLLLEDYRRLYKELFRIADQHNLKIFINTDYLFFNQDIEQHLRSGDQPPVEFFAGVLEEAFGAFPQIDGVILRVGENDGKDVRGHFHSQLLLKTPAQAHRLLSTILPVFERSNKTLIFRTWTVGVYEIGDLIWNTATYDAVFGGIDSSALIVSMKFGDTDFMRYLPLNPLFGRGNHKKIIELQTRREWEAMGMFPSFTGWEYERYLRQLQDNKNVIGIHVWCQTGGWAKPEWSTLTYLDERSFWNELNTEVTIAITKHSLSVEAAVQRFCKRRNITQTNQFLELLKNSETAILKGLYLPDIANQSLYFRRVRIPPLTWMTWDKIHLPVPVIYFHRLLVRQPQNIVDAADQAVAAADRMVKIARSIKLPPSVVDTLVFEYATLNLFAQLKRYVFHRLSERDIQQLNEKARDYMHRYPQHYSIPHLSPYKDRRIPRSLLSLLVRQHASYRVWDRILLRTSPLQARLIRSYLRRTQSHLKDQSMGFEVFFK